MSSCDPIRPNDIRLYTVVAPPGPRPRERERNGVGGVVHSKNRAQRRFKGYFPTRSANRGPFTAGHRWSTSGPGCGCGCGGASPAAHATLPSACSPLFVSSRFVLSVEQCVLRQPRFVRNSGPRVLHQMCVCVCVMLTYVIVRSENFKKK